MFFYDLIVIGAGPAGSTAARYAAKNNLKVLLIDKEKFPRVKPCAAGLPKHIDEIIDFDFSSVIKKITDTTLFTYKFKKPVKLQNEEVKIKMTMRPEFDSLLVEHAVKNGAEFKDSVKVRYVEESVDSVKVVTEKDSYHARYVIGADGAFSITAKSAGLMKDRVMGWSINAEVYVSDNMLLKQGNVVNIEMGFIPAGYAWVFPKDDHLSCGVGTNLSFNINNFKKSFYEYLEKNPTTQKIKKIFMKGHPLPHNYSDNIKINTPRIMLAGDAASLVEPLSGEGIYYAIKSGIVSIKHLLNNMKNNETLDNYSNEINKTFRIEFYYAERFARIFHKFPKLTYDLGVANNLVNQRFKNLLIGKTSYKQMYDELKPLYSNSFVKPAVKIISKISNVLNTKSI
ncbi:geranylgeranyl reductase family protein [Candidatus Dependentiae bacterium]|nr:geranylgeranyl reductase family protein [Candidatus Dependentiae bacterium]